VHPDYFFIFWNGFFQFPENVLSTNNPFFSLNIKNGGNTDARPEQQ
jgi:hypothetical protein